jgi:tripartite-type tricarboxylate transporter receptor subunit TctC
MMNQRTARILRAVFAAAIMLSAGLSAGWAQDAAKGFPSRPIRLVIGFAAGGGNDILARIVMQKVSESLGQPIIIENKAGAQSIIAAEHVKNATPDGYTVMMGAIGAMAINPAVFAKLPYDTVRDFKPLTMLGSFPLILTVAANSPFKNVQDVVAYAKANPDKANYGSSSPAFQLPTELFKMKTGAPIQRIAYRSSGESVLAVISGTVIMTIADVIPVAGQLKAGQVRGLAVTADKRMSEFPDIPTMAEAGVPDMEVGLWTGFFVPSATPPAIAAKLEAEFVRALKSPDVAARLKELGVEPSGNTSQEFARIIERDLARWTAVAKANDIKFEQ